MEIIDWFGNISVTANIWTLMKTMFHVYSRHRRNSVKLNCASGEVYQMKHALIEWIVVKVAILKEKTNNIEKTSKSPTPSQWKMLIKYNHLLRTNVLGLYNRIHFIHSSQWKMRVKKKKRVRVFVSHFHFVIVKYY